MKETKHITREVLSTVKDIQQNAASKSELADIKALVEEIKNGSTTEDFDFEIQQIEELFDEGRILDAREIAFEILEKKGADEPQFLSKINRLIATSYLKDESNQQKAIKYLKKSAKLSDDKKVIFKNRALAFLLELNFDQALINAENLLEVDCSVDSTALKANILWEQGKKMKLLIIWQNRIFPIVLNI